MSVAVSMYNLEVSTLPAPREPVRCDWQYKMPPDLPPTGVREEEHSHNWSHHCTICTRYGHTESCYYGFLFEFWTYHKSPVRNFSLFIIYLIPIMFGILCLMQQKPISMTIIDHPCLLTDSFCRCPLSRLSCRCLGMSCQEGSQL